MKKIILGLVAAFALVSFLAPIASAEEAAAGGDAPKAEKKGKKAKKEKKAEGGDAPKADDAAKK